MQNSARKVLVAAFCVLIIGFVVHIGIGSYAWLKPWEVITQLVRGNHPEDGTNTIIWGTRLPRAIEAGLVGAILGVSGAALQTLFRNQLAEPYIVGSSSGAAIGAASILVLSPTIKGLLAAKIDENQIGMGLVTVGMPLAGFLTGLLTLSLVMSLARRRGVIETPTLLIAGVVVATMLSSLLSFIILAGGLDQRVVLRWLLGGFETAFWQPIWMMAIVFAIAYAVLYKSSNKLNAMALGEEAAQSLGVNPTSLRRNVLICVTAMTSVTVGVAGVIGFVGLITPHAARRFVGSDLRASIPLSAVFGSLLMLFADAIAQRGMQGAGFPVGIVTAIIGAPVLLVLLKRR
jgi:iron complex transport system permease protein